MSNSFALASVSARLRRLRRWLLLSAALILSACANPQPFLPSAATLHPQQGYVGGIFLGHGQGFGFGLVNLSTNETFLMPFFSAEDIVTERGELARIIELPPGRYRLDHWATYHPSSKEYFTKTLLPPQGRHSDIEVKPGKVVFLGKFEVFQRNVAYKTIRYEIDSRSFTAAELQARFKAAYPSVPVEAIEY